MKLTFTLIALCFYCFLNAQKAGTLDSSFGTNGTVLLLEGECHAAIVLKNNKILALGEPDDFDNKAITLIRFNEDGSVDSGFGKNGMVITTYKPQHYIDCIALAEQLDGKIIVAENEDGNEFANILLVRYTANGKLDPSFGQNGLITLDLGKGEFCNAIKIDYKNRIIVAGYRDRWTDENALILRCKPNGELDSSFGINGAIITDTKYNKIFQQATALAIQKDNKIVIGGKTYPNDVDIYESKFLVARFLENGQRDSLFGNNGIVTAQITQEENDLSAIQVRSDGKIIATGTSSDTGTSTYPYAYTGTSLIQFTSSGDIDSSFGHDGKMLNQVPLYNSYATASVLQTDDKLIVAGYIFKRHPEGGGKFMVSRYLPNGFIDTGFGVNGTTITDFTNALASSVGLQKDNKIILAGYNYNYGSEYRYFALARYNNDSTQKQFVNKKVKHYLDIRDAQATIVNNVSIYPNPVQNILHVEGLSSSQTKLTVVDFNGNVIVSCQLSVVSGIYDLNVSSLHAGNYLLKIEANGEVVTKQFVKE